MKNTNVGIQKANEEHKIIIILHITLKMMGTRYNSQSCHQNFYLVSLTVYETSRTNVKKKRKEKKTQ